MRTKKTTFLTIGKGVKKITAELERKDKQITILSQALETISKWELPKSGRFWNDGEDMSYEAAFGSNGVRDYMKDVAKKAIKKSKNI